MEEELAKLSSELFQTFARFEYSLKAAGFHNGDGDAHANWRRFAETVSEAFENPEEEEFKQAIDYMIAHPPKKQKVKNGKLLWEQAVPETDLQADRILIYVRRVRNNLFHGGKFNGHWFAPERSSELLRHSLTILKRCLVESVCINEAYNS